MKRFQVLLSLFLILQSAAAQSRVQNDFDRDGVSDMVLVSIAQDHSLSWQVISGATSLAIFRQDNFGRLGDNLAPANWLEPDGAKLTYQSLQGSSVIWTLLRSDRSAAQVTFGRRGNRVLSGADFNGDRIADAAAIRDMRGGNYEWAVRTSLFAGNSPRPAKVRFGKSGDQVFFGSVSGRGDWLGTARINGSGLRVWLRHPTRRITRSFKIQHGPSASFKILPLKQQKGADLLAVISQSEGNTSVIFVTARGREVGRTMFSGLGEMLVGDFMADTGEELAIQEETAFTVYNPIMKTGKVARWGSGIPVDAININRMTSGDPEVVPTAAPTPDNVPPEENPPPPPGSLQTVCTKLHGMMDKSVLYKPGSGGTSDARTGKPAFLWYELADNPHVANLYVLASNGRMIAIFGFYNVGQPMSRFYSGYPPGTGETGGQLAALAQAAAGSKAVYFYTKNGNCWGPVPDPRLRTGGR